MKNIEIILPIIIISLIVIFLIERTMKKNIDKEYNDENFIAEGMGYGLVFGALLGVTMDEFDFLTFLSMGLLIGMVIGMNIPKKDKRNE